MSSPWPRALDERRRAAPRARRAGLAVDHAGRRPDGRARPTRCISGRTPRTTASASSSLTSAIRRQGSMPARQHASDFQKLPMPATMCWSRSTSPRVRVGSSSRSRWRNRASSKGSGGDEVRTERGETGIGARPRGREQLEHGAVELDDLHVPAPQDEPRGARATVASAAPRREHAPRAGHAQVRVDDEATFEAQQQVLAHGVDGVHPSPREALRPAVAAEARVRRRDLVGDMAGEHGADASRGVVDGVALRHRRAPGRSRGARDGSRGRRGARRAGWRRPAPRRWCRARAGAGGRRALRRRAPRARARRSSGRPSRRSERPPGCTESTGRPATVTR